MTHETLSGGESTASRTVIRPVLGAEWRWTATIYAAFSAIWIALASANSAAYPRLPPEIEIALWPPSAPLGAWVERAILWSITRYDVHWYLRIAENGYVEPGATAFHPLFPLLMGAAGRLLGGNFLLGGWLVAQVCCVAMLLWLYRLVRLDYDASVARRATLLLMASPLGFAFLLPYTESLLMLCIVGALYAGRTGRWGLAGLLGAGAALTKQPGAVVLLALLVELWRAERHRLPGWDPRRWDILPLVRPLAGLSLVPLGLLAWFGYRATLGDMAFDWRSPATLVNSLLVTPDYKDVWGEYFSWPWVNFGYAIAQLQTRPHLYLGINFSIMLVMLALTIAAALRSRPSYAVYAVVMALLNLSIVFPAWPYMGVIRRFTIIFPIFILLGVWGKSRLATGVILIVNVGLWVLIGSMYVRNGFVP